MSINNPFGNLAALNALRTANDEGTQSGALVAPPGNMKPAENLKMGYLVVGFWFRLRNNYENDN